MAAQIALTGFAALGGFIGLGTRYPAHATPAHGLALVALSGTVMTAAIVAVVQLVG